MMLKNNIHLSMLKTAVLINAFLINISDKCCSFELSVHEIILKKCT